MSGNEGYNYGNDYSYGYDYSSQSQNLNQNYNYGNNFSYNNNSDQPVDSIPYTQPSTNQQTYNPAATLLSNPAAQIGMQFGTQAFSAGQEYVNSNVNILIAQSIQN